MNLSYIGLTWFFFSFFAGGFDKAALVLRLEGQKVGEELPFSVWHLLFQPLVQSFLILRTECLQNLTLNFNCFHIFESEYSFFSWGRLVEPFNDLLTFFIFLVYYLRSFLYKGMLLPSFITEAHAQPSAFFSCFQEFFFLFYFFFTCYKIISLTFFFFCLFLFCSTISLIFGF